MHTTGNTDITATLQVPTFNDSHHMTTLVVSPQKQLIAVFTLLASLLTTGQALSPQVFKEADETCCVKDVTIWCFRVH